MALDSEMVKVALPATVPMVGTLALAFVELDERHAVLALPDQAPFHNHIGGPHAGALFTLGESASGALVLMHFGDRLEEATPLAVEATIRYRAVARGEVTAEATSEVDVPSVLAELTSGRRPEFDVDVVFRDSAGRQTGEMSVRWTLKAATR